MRVLRAGENTEFRQHLGRDAVLWEHSLDRVFDDKLGMTLAHQLEAAIAFATDEAGEKHVLVLGLLFAGEDDLLGVDNHNEVAVIDAWGVGGFVAATDNVGGFNSEATEWHAFGIDQMPLGLHSLLLGEKRFHGKRG